MLQSPCKLNNTAKSLFKCPQLSIHVQVVHVFVLCVHAHQLDKGPRATNRRAQGKCDMQSISPNSEDQVQVHTPTHARVYMQVCAIGSLGNHPVPSPIAGSHCNFRKHAGQRGTSPLERLWHTRLDMAVGVLTAMPTVLELLHNMQAYKSSNWPCV